MTRQGGGVCIYIHQDLSYNERIDLNHDDLAATWIELLLPKTKPIICASIYRPPNQTNFYSILDSVCASSNQFHEFEAILLGNCNTNVLGNNTCSLFKSLKSFMYMFNFNQMISEYPRVCTSSSTVIDLILVSDLSKISQSGAVSTCFSDHFLIIVNKKLSKTVIGSLYSVNILSL